MFYHEIQKKYQFHEMHPQSHSNLPKKHEIKGTIQTQCKQRNSKPKLNWTKSNKLNVNWSSKTWVESSVWYWWSEMFPWSVDSRLRNGGPGWFPGISAPCPTFPLTMSSPSGHCGWPFWGIGFPRNFHFHQKQNTPFSRLMSHVMRRSSFEFPANVIQIPPSIPPTYLIKMYIVHTRVNFWNKWVNSKTQKDSIFDFFFLYTWRVAIVRRT